MRLKKENKALQRGLRVQSILGAAGAFLVVILSLPLKAGTQPLALAGNPTPQPSAGLSDGVVAGEISAACVKDIPLGAAGLLSRSFSLTRLAADEQQAVQHKTNAQLQGKTPEFM